MDVLIRMILVNTTVIIIIIKINVIAIVTISMMLVILIAVTCDNSDNNGSPLTLLLELAQHVMSFNSLT